jgi:hypothetical protein
VSVAAAASLLSPSELAEIAQLRLDGLATSIELRGVELVLWRIDEASGDALPLPPVTVARRFANRQPRATATEAATSTRVDGDFRAYAPFDVAVGDTFVLPDGAGQIVPPITEDGQIVTAQFRLDQGAP